MIGSSGNNVPRGMAGDDVLVVGAGNDNLNGGTGTDWVCHKDPTGGVTVGLALIAAHNTGGSGTDTLAASKTFPLQIYPDTGSSTTNVDPVPAPPDSTPMRPWCASTNTLAR